MTAESTMLTKTAARDALVVYLLRDAAAHESGKYELIGEAYDDLDVVMPRGGPADPDERPLFIALSFWDGWIDSRNHRWLFYEPITERDWPNLARSIAWDLTHGREITNPIVRSHFTPRPRKPLWARIRSIFSKR